MKFLRFPKMDKKKMLCALLTYTREKNEWKGDKKIFSFFFQNEKIPNDLYRCGRHGNNRSSPTSFF